MEVVAGIAAVILAVGIALFIWGEKRHVDDGDPPTLNTRNDRDE